MTGRKLAQEVAVRLGRESGVATWGWCELVTHPAASELRDQYVSAVALGIAMNLGGAGVGSYPSFRTLSQRLSISRKVVRRSAWALEAGGWLDAVGKGPHRTIRWNATVPNDVLQVLNDVHHGDGLPWVELLDDELVADAIAAAFVPVAAYVNELKRSRTDIGADRMRSQSDRSPTGVHSETDGPVDPTTEATDGPVGDTAGATDHDGPDPDPEPEPVGDTVGASGFEPSTPVAPTVGAGVGDTVGSETSRDPTKASNENGLEERTHENATCEADGCDRPVAVQACPEDPEWRDLCDGHAEQIREWVAGKVKA